MRTGPGADHGRPQLKVFVTRQLPAKVEARMAELFDVTLNPEDRKLDRDELLELYAIRSAIEALAAHHGAARLSDANLAEMAALLAQLEAFTGGWDAFLEIDKQFHRVIYRAAGSQRWLDTIETLWQRSRRYMLASASASGAIESLHADHRAILAACRAHDGVAAGAAVRAHLERAQSRLLEQWEAT